MKKFKSNNKGIAMITIMITITFLAVIATTLLYISTTNYMMKVSNYKGKQNYYKTDGTLVQTTSAIRNQCMKATDPYTATKSLYTNPSDDACNTYSMLKIAQLVYPNATGGDKNASVNVSTGKIEFKTVDNSVAKTSASGVTTYTFKDVEVIHTSTDGYKNSVRTDLQFDIYEEPNTGGSAGGVGNMSLMLDAPLVLSAANFKCLTMTGNSFMASYDDNSGAGYEFDGEYYVGPASGACAISSQCRVNLKGENNVIYGDLDLSGESSLAVYGNLTVYGDIHVSGGATLIVADGGTIYQFVDEELPGKDHTSEFEATGNVYPASTTVSHVTKEDFKNFASTVGFVKPESGDWDYGLINKVFAEVSVGSDTTRVIDLEEFVQCTSADSSLSITSGDSTACYVRSNDSFYGVSANMGCGFVPGSCTSMLNSGYDNLLLISLPSSGLGLQMSLPYSTVISKHPLTCEQAHCVTISKIGTDEFNYMTAAKNDTESAKYRNSSNPFNKDMTFAFASGTYTGKFGEFFESDCNKTVDKMFGYAMGSDEGSTSKTYYSAMNFKNYSRDFR